MNSNVLELQSVWKSYGKKTIFKDLNLTIPKNKIVGILGPNGAGKSTLFHSIIGLESISQGHILFNGQPIEKLPMHKRAKMGLNYLPQESSVFQKLSVENNIKAILELQPHLTPTESKAKLEEVIDFLHLQKIRKQMGYSLSGGEKRKVEIARILVNNPQVLLLDEPFAGVDPITVHEIQKLILYLIKHLEISIVLTDHNVREILNTVNHIYLMMDGNIFFRGTKDEFIKEESVKTAYLGDGFLL